MLVQMVSDKGRGQAEGKKRTAFLVFMEAPIVPVLVGTESGRQGPSRFIVRFAIVIVIDRYF